MPCLWQQLSIIHNAGKTMATSNKLKSDHLQANIFQALQFLCLKCV